MAKKVLIIDDEDAARLVIRQYLGAFEELQIIGECSHGQEAVTAINRLEPDLVFLDVQMPGLSGFQVIQQISTCTSDHLYYCLRSICPEGFRLQCH